MDIATLDNHEDKFLQVLELIPTALVMVNQHGIITMLNVQAERIFCYARQELVGKPMDLLLPERYRAHHFHHIDLFFKNPETRYIGKGRDLFGLRSDGKEIPIEIGLKQIATSDGINVLVVIVDISERKLAGLALTEASDRLKKIANRVPGVVYQFRMRPDPLCQTTCRVTFLN